MKRIHLITAAVVAHALPVAAWAMVKPIRVLAPQWLGLTCTNDNICIDDMSRIAEARALLREAHAFVDKDLGAIRARPRAVFCSTPACDAGFGLGRSAAFNVGTHGIILSRFAWKPFFVRHELIHHLQNERLGTMTAWLLKPSWLIEGMAYTRSQDPRQPLPEPLQAWRHRYQAWAQNLPPEALWAAAREAQ